jgi:hypothetical protein
MGDNRNTYMHEPLYRIPRELVPENYFFVRGAE